MQIIKPPQEQQVGDLFNDLHRIRDATTPEGIPNGVNFRAEFTSNHAASVSDVAYPMGMRRYRRTLYGLPGWSSNVYCLS